MKQPAAKIPSFVCMTGEFFRLTRDEVKTLDDLEKLWVDHRAECKFNEHAQRYDLEAKWDVLVKSARQGDLDALKVVQQYQREETYISLMLLAEQARHNNFLRINAHRFDECKPMVKRIQERAEKFREEYLDKVAAYRKTLGLPPSVDDPVTTKLRFVLNECSRILAHNPTEFERPLSDHLSGLISEEETTNDNDDDL